MGTVWKVSKILWNHSKWIVCCNTKLFIFVSILNSDFANISFKLNSKQQGPVVTSVFIVWDFLIFNALLSRPTQEQTQRRRASVSFLSLRKRILTQAQESLACFCCLNHRICSCRKHRNRTWNGCFDWLIKHISQILTLASCWRKPHKLAQEKGKVLVFAHVLWFFSCSWVNTVFTVNISFCFYACFMRLFLCDSWKLGQFSND